MLPASRAAWVPVFIATPTSAWASAGASSVPSPHMATSLPLACSSRISRSLSSGVAWARKSSTPHFRRDRGRGQWIVAGDHDGADAHAAQFGEPLADAALDDILEVNDAGPPAVLRETASGVPPDLAIASAIALISRMASALTAGICERTAPPAATVSDGALRNCKMEFAPPLAHPRACRFPPRSCGSGR